MEWARGDHVISTDKARLDVPLLHRFLSTDAYWAKGRSRETVDKSLQGSLCFGLYGRGGAQVGFARAVTDGATFAWIADVFVVPEARGKGLATWLMQIIVEHPDVKGLRRVLLGTRDAHELYRKVGFSPLRNVERFMEIFNGA